MFEKQSLTNWWGRSRVASTTMLGRSSEAYIISGARYSSEVKVISEYSCRPEDPAE